MTLLGSNIRPSNTGRFPTDSPSTGLSKWLEDNGLSVAFFSAFALSFVAQAISGQRADNAQMAAHHQAPLGFIAYLGTGHFLDGIFSNWQAAILQLACLILFSKVLRQKGASHSLKPRDETPKGGAGAGGKAGAPKGDTTPARAGGGSPSAHPNDSWFWRNSLSIAFVSMFVLTFAAHLYFGTWSYNEMRALTADPPIGAAAYALTGQFWFSTVETWQAEFIGIFLFIVLSIYLRQEGSSESKHVDSTDAETGDPNE